MPETLKTWYSSAELDALAQRGAVLAQTLELSRLTRLAGLLWSDAGTVEAALELAPRRAGWTPAELRFETCLQMTCQRCLEPFELRLAERVELGIVESASMEACLPEDRVAVTLEDERMSPMQLLEDELIVSLPLVPRHEGSAECGGLAHDQARSDVRVGAGSHGLTPPTDH